MSQPSLLVLPSQYSAGKLFAYSPLVAAPVEFEVIRATPRTRVNSNGLIETIGNNIAAFDYGAGNCPAFNPWGQRTNLLTWSEAFDNANWLPANVKTTANTTASPEGTLTADSILSTDGLSEHMVRAVTSMAVSTVYTVSVFAKQITTRYAYIRDLTNNLASVFDLQNGIVSFQAAGHVARMEAVGSFYRISITFTTPAVIANNLIDFGITILANNFTSAVPIGEGIAFWGAQLEAGSSASPYIPTTSSSVTRNAEIIRNTSASAYIGATQGAIAGRFIAGANAGHIVDISTGATNNSIQIDYGNVGAGILRATVFTAGVPHTIISTTALSAGSHGFCFTYQSGNFALYVDGVLVGTNTAAFLPSGLDEIYLGSNIGTSPWFNGYINHVRFFKEIPNNPANESAK